MFMTCSFNVRNPYSAVAVMLNIIVIKFLAKIQTKMFKNYLFSFYYTFVIIIKRLSKIYYVLFNLDRTSNTKAKKCKGKDHGWGKCMRSIARTSVGTKIVPALKHRCNSIVFFYLCFVL